MLLLTSMSLHCELNEWKNSLRNLVMLITFRKVHATRAPSYCATVHKYKEVEKIK
jgi:hypothetical protein